MAWDDDLREKIEAARLWLSEELELDDEALMEVIGGGWYSTDLYLCDEASDEPLPPSADTRWYFAGDVGRVGLGVTKDEIHVVRGVDWGFGQLPVLGITPVADVIRGGQEWRTELTAAVVEASKQVRSRYAMCWHCHQLRYTGRTRNATDLQCDWCSIAERNILF